MATSRNPSNRTVLLTFAGTSSFAVLFASIAFLVWFHNPGIAAEPAKAGKIPADGKRFTLRLGQGFRFKDGAVVVANRDEHADIVFKYLPKQLGGAVLRYNPISQQVEQGFEPTLTSPVPLLLATHVNAFEDKPNVARITTGDVAGYQNQSPIFSKTRYLLLMNDAGDPYLLTLDELEAVEGKYDEWRIGFKYEPVQLPLGLAGGKVNKPLPGKLIYRDWYRTKMIMRIDLTNGKEEALVDGTLPCAVGERFLGYGDATAAYVVRDAAGKILNTIRFNEEILGPLLSPDGTKLVGTAHRPGPDYDYGGGIKVAGPSVLAVAVFDLTGKELVEFRGYDDATWTPDGKLIATGPLNDPGLFELGPATKQTRAIDAKIASPFQPDVSPDGKTIAFVTGNKVWLIDRDGKNLRQLFPDGHNQQRPAFSPDGTKIAIIVCNLFAIDASGEVFVIDVKAKEVTPVRTNGGASLIPDPTTRVNWVR